MVPRERVRLELLCQVNLYLYQSLCLNHALTTITTLACTCPANTGGFITDNDAATTAANRPLVIATPTGSCSCASGTETESCFPSDVDNDINTPDNTPSAVGSIV